MTCPAWRREGVLPFVRVGDRIRFWTVQTGLTPQLGTVRSIELLYGTLYAAIEPDAGGMKYLFFRAVWGFEPLEVQT